MTARGATGTVSLSVFRVSRPERPFPDPDTRSLILLRRAAQRTNNTPLRGPQRGRAGRRPGGVGAGRTRNLCVFSTALYQIELPLHSGTGGGRTLILTTYPRFPGGALDQSYIAIRRVLIPCLGGAAEIRTRIQNLAALSKPEYYQPHWVRLCGQPSRSSPTGWQQAPHRELFALSPAKGTRARSSVQLGRVVQLYTIGRQVRAGGGLSYRPPDNAAARPALDTRRTALWFCG